MRVQMELYCLMVVMKFEQNMPGAQFLIHVLQNLGDSRRVRWVNLLKSADDEFVDFPNIVTLAKFDRSDRKFAALAKKSGVAVTNATDSDWVDFQEPLSQNGITVNFLCGCVKGAWFRN
jgi:hypothetical protein